MDIQRIVLFAGLAIVSYMMVLAWNEDYNLPQTQQIAEQSSSRAPSGDSDNMTLPEGSSGRSDSSGEEFVTPEGDSQAIGATENGAANVSDQLITVRTDVFELKNRSGGRQHY